MGVSEKKVVTVSAVGGGVAEVVANLLATEARFAVAATAGSFTQLVANRAFPTRLVIVAESDDRARTLAQISLAHGLGARVVLVVSDDRSTSLDWSADLVVPASVERRDLIRLADAQVRARHPHPSAARRRAPRPLTSRESEALILFSHFKSVVLVAEEMNVSSATASTFLWRARRKMRAGAT